MENLRMQLLKSNMIKKEILTYCLVFKLFYNKILNEFE